MNEELFKRFCEKFDIQFKEKQAFERLCDQEQFELLEFLGDSFLNFLITSEIFKLKGKGLGERAKIKAYLISGFNFSMLAEESGLKQVLFAEQQTDRKAEDLFEALAGLLFADRGYRYARKKMLELLKDSIKRAGEGYKDFDYKSQFQEYTQKTYGQLPEFRLMKEEGPDHKKKFEVNVYIKDMLMGTGTDYTKKGAQQKAAKMALEKIKKTEGNLNVY